MEVITLPGVFRPRSDAPFLAEALRAEPRLPGGRVLDLCTGSGILALEAARAGAMEVVAVDLSWRAVMTTRLNARRHAARLRVVRGDLYAPVAGSRYDVIVSNPPYLPAPDGAVPRHRAAQAWDAGPDGRVLLDRICRQAPDHLVPGGSLLLVHSSVNGERRTLELLRDCGLDAEVVRRSRGALGPLLRSRASYLRAQGLLADGELAEDMLVMRAVAPQAVARSKASSPALRALRTVTATPASAQADATQNAAG